MQVYPDNPRRNREVLMGRQRSSSTKQKKYKTSHLVYIVIIVALMFVIFYSVGESKATKTEEQQNGELKKEVRTSSSSKNNERTEIPTTPKKYPNKQLSPPSKAKPINPQKYMPPELVKISQKRRQVGGMMPVKKGTVSQIKYLKKNAQGNTIEEVLYNETTREKRLLFQKQRVLFLRGRKSLQSIFLATFNNKIDQSRNVQQKQTEEHQWERIDNQWQFEKYSEELPMCLVVPGYNNNDKFRIQYNLNSIFQQNYTNYFAVIINDASTDNSDMIYRKYLNFYNIDKNKYVYIENDVRKSALENTYLAIHNYCSPDSIVVTVDGDDELIGKNVLKMFNAGYQLHKAGVIYSNFYWYDQGRNIMLGFTSEYTKNDKNTSNYRKAPQRFASLKSFRTELFLKINPQDNFKDGQGKFFTSSSQMVMFFPLMELACGRVNKIKGFHYLYNINTGLNDYAVDRNKQVNIDQSVRRKPKLSCSQEFDEKMKKGN